MSNIPTITIDMDKKCVECGKPGSVENKLCLRCMTNASDPKRKMKSAAGQSAQRYWQRMRGKP